MLEFKKNIIIKFKAILRILLLPIFTFLPSRRNSAECRNIVIVRTDGIGDFVMWAGAINVIRAHYKGKKLSYICPLNYLSLVKALGLFDEVIPVDKKQLETNPWYQIKTIRQFKKIHADVVINPVKSRLYPSDYIIKAISAKEKIGVLKGENNRYRKDKFYTRLIDVPSNLHEMKYTEYFTQELIGGHYHHKLADFSGLAKQADSENTQPYCLIALSSTDERKIWEIEKVCEVINSIPEKYAVALTGYGPVDEQRAKYIKNHVKAGIKLLDYVSKTSIFELVQLVAGASFVLGNDSSTVHIAAASRVPSICYMTGATYNSFLPYPESMDDRPYHPRVVVKKMDCFGCWYHCAKPYEGSGPLMCLKEVTVPMVLKELNALLNEIN
mgnify:CR=1 FL=1